jgi:hypothetical protein
MPQHDRQVIAQRSSRCPWSSDGRGRRSTTRYCRCNYWNAGSAIVSEKPDRVGPAIDSTDIVPRSNDIGARCIVSTDSLPRDLCHARAYSLGSCGYRIGLSRNQCRRTTGPCAGWRQYRHGRIPVGLRHAYGKTLNAKRRCDAAHLPPPCGCSKWSPLPPPQSITGWPTNYNLAIFAIHRYSANGRSSDQERSSPFTTRHCNVWLVQWCAGQRGPRAASVH